MNEKRDGRQIRVLNARYQAAVKDLQQYLETAFPDLAKARLNQGKKFSKRAAFAYQKIIQIRGAVEHLDKMVDNDSQDLSALRSALETTESTIHSLKLAFVEDGVDFGNSKELDAQVERDLAKLELDVKRIELSSGQTFSRPSSSVPGGGLWRSMVHIKNPSGNWSPEDHAIFERCFRSIKDDEIRLVERVSQLCGLSKTAVKEHLSEYRK